jgi:hypothetical protein
MWDPDINYPAPIPIIAHAYLLLTLSSMHALTSRRGSTTSRTVHNRQGTTSTVRIRKELTRNSPQLPRGAARLA